MLAFRQPELTGQGFQTRPNLPVTDRPNGAISGSV